MKNDTDVRKSSRLLIETDDQAQTAVVIDILEQNGIAAYAKGRGIGGVLDAYVGYSLYGDDIYVEEGAWDRARGIVEKIPLAETKS